jgi:hypothetical protein
MNAVAEIAPDEPLSPELVLVLPGELRAQVLANLGPPVRPAPPPLRLVPDPPQAAEEPLARALGGAVATRLAHLGLVFATVTIVTLAMSLVAHAMR